MNYLWKVTAVKVVGKVAKSGKSAKPSIQEIGSAFMMRTKELLFISILLFTVVNTSCQNAPKSETEVSQIKESSKPDISKAVLEINAMKAVIMDISSDNRYILYKKVRIPQTDIGVGQNALYLYDCQGDSTSLLVMSYTEGEDGNEEATKLDKDYGDSFPFLGAGIIGNAKFNSDHTKVYFDCEAWEVSSAIMCFDINSNSLSHLFSGSLEAVLHNDYLLCSSSEIINDEGRHVFEVIKTPAGEVISKVLID